MLSASALYINLSLINLSLNMFYKNSNITEICNYILKCLTLPAPPHNHCEERQSSRILGRGVYPYKCIQICVFNKWNCALYSILLLLSFDVWGYIQNARQRLLYENKNNSEESICKAKNISTCIFSGFRNVNTHRCVAIWLSLLEVHPKGLFSCSIY